ncbi:MerR family transcriptional regulator [Acetobacterium woodii]|uniref:Transcriptional regulator MerR family n=1 Tax=Acetobacterium woodii (strain ATCC 29683 / DSM 1030 / JCM 2381 / KCTC 1655 / WB1) TaxID=931626 RepID=H6LGE4_ACEWD|nr:MerR family transcriptional regulator [Acetobacterium woodii]AFA47080.1 transcriptional regulator MerR family [Acetobacterium woodii DSM 1030]
MFKIGEFSKLTQVSIRMLRYYDETALLKPTRIDPDTSYRFYSLAQIPVLQKIIFLRDLGYTVAEIKVALEHWSGDFITEQLRNKQTEVRRSLELEQEKLKKIERAMASIQKDKIDIRYDFTIKRLPSYPVISLRRVIPDYFGEGILWQELTELISQTKIDLPTKEQCFAIYHDTEFKEKDVDVEVCIVVNNQKHGSKCLAFREIKAVERMACTMVYGPYQNISGVFQSFAYWLTQNADFKMIGKNRQICHRGPWNETNPEHYLTEIQIELEKI